MAAEIKIKLQSQLEELESELRVHLPKEIKRALEFGDLRENSEYRAALDRQNVVKARIVELRQRISEISSIDLSKISRDKAGYGSTLVLYDGERDEEVTDAVVSLGGSVTITITATITVWLNAMAASPRVARRDASTARSASRRDAW